MCLSVRLHSAPCLTPIATGFHLRRAFSLEYEQGVLPISGEMAIATRSLATLPSLLGSSNGASRHRGWPGLGGRGDLGGLCDRLNDGNALTKHCICKPNTAPATAHYIESSFLASMLLTKPPAELRYAMQGTIAELPLFFELLEAWGREQGVPIPLAASFGLMLDELLTNIATHGYVGHGGPVEVVVHFSDDPPSLQAVLRDRAVAFDPTSLGEPDVGASMADRDVGGLGIHFVRKLADRVNYRRDGDTNELTVSKTWRARADDN